MPRSFLIALIVAILVHALLIFGLKLELPRSGQPGRPAITMTLMPRTKPPQPEIAPVPMADMVMPTPAPELPPTESETESPTAALPQVEPPLETAKPAEEPPRPAAPPAKKAPENVVKPAKTEPPMGPPRPGPAQIQVGPPRPDPTQLFVGPPRDDAATRSVGPPTPPARVLAERKRPPEPAPQPVTAPAETRSPETPDVPQVAARTPEPPPSPIAPAQTEAPPAEPPPAKPRPAPAKPAPAAKAPEEDAEEPEADEADSEKSWTDTLAESLFTEDAGSEAEPASEDDDQQAVSPKPPQPLAPPAVTRAQPPAPEPVAPLPRPVSPTPAPVVAPPPPKPPQAAETPAPRMADASPSPATGSPNAILPPPRKPAEPKVPPKPKPEPKPESRPTPPPKAEAPPVVAPEKAKKPPVLPPHRRREPVVKAEAQPPAAKPVPKSRHAKRDEAEAPADADKAAAKKGRKSAEAKPARSDPAEKDKGSGKAAKSARDVKPSFSAGLLSQQIAEVGADMTRQRTADWEDKKIVHTTAVKTNRLVVAAYEQAWQEKVERIGNLNYPDEARRNKLAGTLVLAVGIRQDGSVYSVHLQQSSGYEVLDQSARHIIDLAGPFAPLPREIRDEVNVLVITRTWRFDSNFQLTTGKGAGRGR